MVFRRCRCAVYFVLVFVAPTHAPGETHAENFISSLKGHRTRAYIIRAVHLLLHVVRQLRFRARVWEAFLGIQTLVGNSLPYISAVFKKVGVFFCSWK